MVWKIDSRGLRRPRCISAFQRPAKWEPIEGEEGQARYSDHRPDGGLIGGLLDGSTAHMEFTVKFAPNIPERLRVCVLSSGNFACSMCGAGPGDTDPYAPNEPVSFHVAYLLEEWEGGAAHASNLRALCSVCNEGAQNISPKRPEWVDLLVQIRRAPALDQVEALKWLMKKFPKQAAANLKN